MTPDSRQSSVDPYWLRGVKEGGGDDAIHIRVGVLTLCGQDPNSRNWVEAVHSSQADCWTCQMEAER
jgi:hypothetical protein